MATSFDEKMGGSVRAPLNIAKYSVAAGVHADVVATFDVADDVSYLSTEYGEVRHKKFVRAFPRHNFRSPTLSRWLLRHVSDYDLVEIHGVFSFPPLYAATACVRARVPYTVRPHGQLEPYDLAKHAAAKQAYGRVMVRQLLHRSATVLLTTRQELERMQGFGASCRQRVVRLPVQEPAGRGDGRLFRARHGIPEDAVVVLCLGRFDHKKGMHLLLPALAALKQEHPRLWLLLVGSGDAAATRAIRKMIAETGVSGWCSEVGFLSGHHKQSAFAASDIFALPSLNENFGIVVVEAMYASLALLLSDEVYVSDIPAQGGAAVLCQPTVASCTTELGRLLREGDLVAMGKHARSLALTHFSPQTATRELLTVYTDILGRPSHAPSGQPRP